MGYHVPLGIKFTRVTELWSGDKTEAPEEAGHIIRIRRKRLPEE